ncbi:MAG TPA: hypothetical protein VN369_06355 [Terriglobales bacterium]|nr:hypothetical protein [Terriglobales bacterium]
MENKRVFRNSISGFNKADVSKYIGELGRKVDAEIDARKKAEEAAEAAKKELAAAKAESSALAEKLQSLQEECTALRGTNEAMAEKTRTHYEDRVKAAKESDALYARIAELEGELPQLRERAAKYERNAIHIADAMISAREESERIISKATKTAAEIRSQLAAELARVGEEAEKLGDQYLSIKKDAFDCTERLHGVLEAMCVELEGVQGRLAQMRSAIEQSGSKGE